MRSSSAPATPSMTRGCYAEMMADPRALGSHPAEPQPRAGSPPAPQASTRGATHLLSVVICSAPPRRLHRQHSCGDQTALGEQGSEQAPHTLLGA